MTAMFPMPAKTAIGITVARTFEDLMRVAAIRNAVYIGEQECPYEEEYDGNDLSATHLLAYIGDEPVGCLRLRFFADFAKFERMAIRKEFRKIPRRDPAGAAPASSSARRRAIAGSMAIPRRAWSISGAASASGPMEGRKHFVFSDYRLCRDGRRN